MHVTKLAAGGERYYLDSVAAGAEDLRAPGLEPDGRWMGRGAIGLDLVGRVGAYDLGAVLAGADPSTGERLNPAQALVRVVGFDLTFSAPKSVSVLFGLAGYERGLQVRAGHDAAVADALGYLEREAVTALRQSEGERWSVPTEGVVAAGFLHHTSRAADPHLHTHVLVANLVKGDDGRWSAVDGRGLYAHGTTALALYQCRLRQELVERLGLAWGPVVNGVANLEGIDRAVLSMFSQRRIQLEAELQAWRKVPAIPGAAAPAFGPTMGSGGDPTENRHQPAGPRALELAALATRPAKDQSRSLQSLQVEWRRRAAEA
ncbi:MAG: MobF family relaxase, partial [Acidimicrobiales bacterium]